MANNFFCMLTLLLTQIYFSFSQSYKNIDGPEIENSKTTIVEFLGEINKSHYVLKKRIAIGPGYIYSIDMINDKMVRTKTNEYDLKPIDGIKRGFEKCLILKDKIYLFSMGYDKSKKKNIIYSQTIDIKSLALSQDVKEVVTMDGETLSGEIFKWLWFSASADASKLLISYAKMDKKTDLENYEVFVFDDSMNKLTHKQVETSIKYEVFMADTFAVANDGSFCFVGLEFKDKKSFRKKSLIDKKIHIYTYNNNGDFIKENEINIEDKFIKEFKIAIAEGGMVNCIGLFSKYFKSNGFSGYYFGSISKGVLTSKFYEFPSDYIIKNSDEMDKKQIEKKKKKQGHSPEFYDYIIDKIHLTKGNKVVIIAEQIATTQEAYFQDETALSASAHAAATTDTYIGSSIVIIMNGITGDFLQSAWVLKSQIALQPGWVNYCSASSAIVGETVYLFYNDDPGNYKKDKKDNDYRPIQFSSGITGDISLVIAEIMSDGKVNKYAVFTTGASGVIVAPRKSLQFRDNEMLFYGEKLNHSKNQYNKIVF